VSKSHPEFSFLLCKVTAGHSKKQEHLNDKLSKLLYIHESDDISKNDSVMIVMVDVLSGSDSSALLPDGSGS
jgi:signal recognition particle GTPase